MNWLLSLVSNKYNRLDSNSELFKNNHSYFEELNRQLEDKRKEKFFSSLIGLLSFYKVVSKCEKCIQLVDEFFLFIDAKIDWHASSTIGILYFFEIFFNLIIFVM